MAGIYIHIPFCKQKCHYCNFFSVASEKLKKGFMEALYNEIEQQKDYLGDQVVKTIYLGGGTPSLLKQQEIYNLVFAIYNVFDVAKEAEITIEVNPDDVTGEWLAELKETDVNRISIGVQSFHDQDLEYLNRLHDAEHAIMAVEMIKKADYENISLDLIYGIPSLDEKAWINNLNQFFNLDVPHLSAYALTVESKTALKWLIRKQRVSDIDEEKIAVQFRILQEMTARHAYIHYEISNFAKEGYYSKHNSIYWLGDHYLGIGPSAHSFNGHSRQWNVSNISRYIEKINYKALSYEKEVLSEKQRFNEYVMTSLRTIWGLDLEHIENVFGTKYKAHLLSHAQAIIQDNKLEKTGNKLFLTLQGKLYADGVAAGLFLI
ncbi:MAG: radical SAM family heme chaperone HemW [Bacteroidota bacterium]|nr:radical SAM family heme chaperone HemW [Bacteroidota bacterium]